MKKIANKPKEILNLEVLVMSKKTIFLALYIVFLILTFIGVFLVLSRKVDNARYSVIPMLFGLIFASLYHKAKKDENK